MKLRDFAKFEKQNPYPVNVLKYDEEADKIYTARLSDKCYCKKEENARIAVHEKRVQEKTEMQEKRLQKTRM